MRKTLLPVLTAGLLLVAPPPVLKAQGGGKLELPRTEALALRQLIDNVVAGVPAAGDAWLKFDSHFMRAQDGLVYVPFTVTLDDLTTAFESLAMYVRVLPRGTTSIGTSMRVQGSELGVAVSVPERQFSRGAPTAGEASARLGLMANEVGALKIPFEGFFTARGVPRDSPLVRRSFVVAPGQYDVYVAVRERPRGRTTPKVAVLQSALIVPDLTGNELAMSSVIVAERIEALTKRLSPTQHVERPYVFNQTEVFPVSSSRFAPDDVLSLVFFVYNLNVDTSNLPDVSVVYRFHQMSRLGRVFGEMEPQRFSASHTAPSFDAKAGRQLAVTQALSLAPFPPDTYEMEILVTDNLSGQSLQRVVRFTVD